MTENCIYSQFLRAKNDDLVAVFNNSHWMFSKYNPERDVKLFFTKINDSKQAVIIGGVGSALHIKKALENQNISLIIAVEKNNATLDFCKKQIDLFNEKADDIATKEYAKIAKIIGDRIHEKVVFCTIAELNQTIKAFYNPILHGNLSFLPVATWLENFESIEEKNALFEIIENTIAEISADISTQSFFGKIWHTNILENLQTLEKHNKKILALSAANAVARTALASTSASNAANTVSTTSASNEANAVARTALASTSGETSRATVFTNIENDFFDTIKTAAIIGAGPTLDKSVSKIKANRQKYFVIATDTAFFILQKYNIQIDCLVTLDGQTHSTKHFIGQKCDIPLFVFDLCANKSVVKKIAQNAHYLLPVTSGHPLVNCYSSWLQAFNGQDFITSLSAGNGTVLQLAFDFAYNAGFCNFEFFGADFAFKNNKAYAKGTYLESSFLVNSSKINSFENQNTSLIYKNATIKLSDCLTSKVLQSYKDYFDKYFCNIKKMQQKECKIKLFNNIKVENFILENIKVENIKVENLKVEFENFLDWYLEKIKKNDKKIVFSLLPLAAWLNKYNKNSDIYKEALYITRRHKK